MSSITFYPVIAIFQFIFTLVLGWGRKAGQVSVDEWIKLMVLGHWCAGCDVGGLRSRHLQSRGETWEWGARCVTSLLMMRVKELSVWRLKCKFLWISAHLSQKAEQEKLTNLAHFRLTSTWKTHCNVSPQPTQHSHHETSQGSGKLVLNYY